MVWPVLAALTVADPSLMLTAAVGKLGAPGFPEREAAVQTLLAAGQASVGPLTTAARSTDPELRRRAAGLLNRIEAERFGRPTLINLHTDSSPPDAVIADLARQTGYALSLADRDGQPLPAVTLSRDRVPFWAAVDAVCAAGGLTASVQDDGAIEFRPGDAADPFVCYAGPFRLTATGVHANQNRQLAGLPRRGLPPAGPDQIDVSFALTAEPKAAVVGVGPPAVHVADDDRGLSLKPAPAAERTSYYPPGVGPRAFVHGFSVGLHRRERTATVIHSLRGTVPVAVLADARPDVAVDLTAGPWGRSVRGRTATLTFHSAAVADGLYAVELTAASPGDPADGWHAGLLQRLELTDAAGTVWPFAGVANLTGDDRSARCKVQFRPPTPDAKPARLTLMEWRTVSRDVAFEFTDIPLP